MKELNISDFKSRCLSLLREITEPLIVSSRGKKLVVIFPYKEKQGSRILGQGAGLEIIGDIIEPSGEWASWES